MVERGKRAPRYEMIDFRSEVKLMYPSWLWLTVLTMMTGLLVAMEYPKFLYQEIRLSAVLERAPLIAVGSLSRIRSLGVQTVDFHPQPGIAITALHWCEGQFRSSHAIRGSFSGTRRFIWASLHSGCEIEQAQKGTGRPGTESQVWFFREERDVLRPVVDVIGYYYCTFRMPWRATREPEVQLGELFLTPEANARSLQEFAGLGFFQSASLSCQLLGERRCTVLLRKLSERGDPSLEKAACEFLQSQFNSPCGNRRR